MNRRVSSETKSRVFIAVALLALGGLLSPGDASAENWPRFRGPEGNGIAPAQGIPTTWTKDDYAWVVDLPGEGHGAPVIWGDKLFVTSATDAGASRSLYCLRTQTGQILWSKSIPFGTNKKHAKNSYASGTPAVDGERVYVAFADAEKYTLFAFTMDGKALWKQELGQFASQHGQGASPIVFEDLVILPNDQDGPSAIVAFDRRDGTPVWKTERVAREASYATPLIIEPVGRKPELICVSGATGLSSLDPWTGKLNWQTESLPQRTVASPAYALGKLYTTCGQGGKGTLMVGVEPPPQPQTTPVPFSFKRDRTLPYVPCIIGFGQHLYLWNDNGVVLCIDPAKEEPVWQERVGGNYSGSPICIGGKLYCLEESGKVAVLDASPTFKLYGLSELGDPSHSTPAVADGRLYLRSFHKLACLVGTSTTTK